MKTVMIGGHPRLSINRPTTSMQNSSLTTRSASTNASTGRKPTFAKTFQPKVNKIDMSQVKPDYNEICATVSNRNDLKNLDIRTLFSYKSTVKDHIAEMAASENYDECKKSLKILQLIKKEIASRTCSQSSANGEPEEDFKAKEEEINSKYEQQLQQINQKYSEKIEQIQTEHKKQTDDFDTEWSTVEPNKYRKPSKNLLNLKEIEQFYAKSNQFEKAKEIHQETEIVSQQETMMAQEKLIKDYRNAKINLRLQQQKDIHSIEELKKKELQDLEINKQNDLNQLEKRKKVLLEKSKSRNPRERKDFNSNVHLSQTSRPPVLLGPLFAPNEAEFKRKREREMMEKRRRAAKFIKENANRLFDDLDSVVSFSTIGSKSECPSAQSPATEPTDEELMKDIYMEISQPMFSIESMPLDYYN
ncbi:hypothetical protein TVAG_165280 [Trichomonas vaginalis G3]|uniref:Uncharacterized protein n=1 Tax=Trichomonas vaginalis (strain ATCC PRA-98 / G3) TaxID=412133 RepID=A2DUK9_TRIV3|nr:hypothetical protein TVAGG3_0662990 [Trichomonas vaginalis G3]EAY15900.1 hypothetical protein TVAG_165280 [Trichomonas vaginalis G3]KAI5506639.1 hypothetical protein TVAGG3_0662990 [Trichomonas vaginalis G3]|eukprot:XP_001328123.1 hypothetical protein [Trichomonas vaginalis G3]